MENCVIAETHLPGHRRFAINGCSNTRTPVQLQSYLSCAPAINVTTTAYRVRFCEACGNLVKKRTVRSCRGSPIYTIALMLLTPAKAISTA